MKTQVIIPLAGSGARLNAGTPKALLKLNHKLMALYALEIFEDCGLVDSVVLVTQKQFFNEWLAAVQAAGLKKVKRIIEGGVTRADSVSNGLAALDDDTRIVLIHDGARPLVTGQLVSDAIWLCHDYSAVIAAVPVKPTVKQADTRTLTVTRTLDRSSLWEVQTPQVFHAEVIKRAYAERGPGTAALFTDDAVLVERLGVPVKILMGDYKNIKITTGEDIVIAEALLSGLSAEGSNGQAIGK
ncbi:MAG: 2-C-methyl-D-erythritol 4-phosphate cytidylyltransferase [Candidatus Omnitrophica bacterium]|nr:2-C-methyl-D-erythritol 4-phosphate cytidylyltransferase [Candidatus Omnitrophota bacterium]